MLLLVLCEIVSVWEGVEDGVRDGVWFRLELDAPAHPYAMIL